jgi:hypothetical protein
MDKVVIVSTKEAKPRGLYVTGKNVTEHGPTRGCGGCTSLAMGTARQPHNEACRERFMQLLKSEAKAKNAERRKREVIENEEEMGKARATNPTYLKHERAEVKTTLRLM